MVVEGGVERGLLTRKIQGPDDMSTIPVGDSLWAHSPPPRPAAAALTSSSLFRDPIHLLHKNTLRQHHPEWPTTTPTTAQVGGVSSFPDLPAGLSAPSSLSRAGPPPSIPASSRSYNLGTDSA